MNSSSNFNADADDVEALLRAAQDDVLLKLSLNSHIAKTPAASSSSLHPELDSRLQALKSHKSKSNIDANAGKKSPGKVEKNPEKVENIDDLDARFAALRGSIPAQSNEVGFGEEKEEEDEVEQLIKWAIDAARLDPSPPSDEGEDSDDDSEDDSDDDGVDHHKVDAAKRKSKK